MHTLKILLQMVQGFWCVFNVWNVFRVNNENTIMTFLSLLFVLREFGALLHRLNFLSLFLITLSGVGFNPQLTLRYVVNLVWLPIPVRCWVSARSQYLVSFLSLCCVTGGSYSRPTYWRTFSPVGIETHTVHNSASKVAGLQVHVTTPG